MKLPHRLGLCCLVALCSNGLDLQAWVPSRESGIPLYSVYNLDELEVGLSTLNLAQDPAGRLMIYEDGNLFTFNGSRWRRQLEVENAGSVIVKLADSERGVTYAGAIGDWGKLVSTANGNYRFESLSMGMDRSWASTNRFAIVVPEEQGAVFIGETAIVRYHALEGNQTWKWLNSPSTGFRLKGRTFVATQESGVFEVAERELKPVPELESFHGDKAIFHTVQNGDGSVMLSTRSRGFYTFDGQTVSPISTEVDALMQSSVTGLTAIEGGYLALAIKGRGIFFLDPQFHVVAHIDRDVDATFVSATDLHYQQGGILWVSVPDGIGKIHFPSPTSLIDERMGAFLLWPKLYRHEGKLYIASNGLMFEGVYDAHGNLERFESISVPGAPILRSAMMTEAGLLFGREDELFQWNMQTDAIERITRGVTSNLMVRLKTRPNHAVVLGADFHQLLQLDGERWKAVGDPVPSSGYSCVAVENAQGDVWVEHGINQFARLEISDEGMQVHAYQRVPGLPEGWVNLWTWRDTTYASCGGGIVQFDSETEQFVEAVLPPWLKPTMLHEIVRPQEDIEGNVWITSSGKVFLMRPDGEAWTRDDETLALIKENQQELFLDETGRAFIFSKNRIFAFDSSIHPPKPLSFEPLLEQVSTTREDRVLYSGIFEHNDPEVVLPYRDNALDFRFFCPALYQTRNLRFSYWLEGLDTGWSTPGLETHAAYTNLPEGDYTFWLRTEDLSGQVRGQTHYRFSVEPPFYRTLPAYVVYGLSVIALLYLFLRSMLLKSEQEQNRLERLVQERTEQLNTANEELREAVVRAEHAKNAKARFLANMSHEIRTPLNGVVGMTEILKRMQLGREQQEIVNTIDSSSHLLLSVINDILDYSRFESGPVEFEHIRFDPVQLIENCLSLLHHAAQDHSNIFYADIDPHLPRGLMGDVTRIEQILINLASNALKFTRNGVVCLRARVLELQGDQCTVEIAVADTGIGIAEDKQERLFRPFSQVDPSNTRIYGGSGLGLAICKKLVDEMGGTISVQSELGQGATFTVLLSLEHASVESEALQGDEIPQCVMYFDEHRGRGEAIRRFLEGAGIPCVLHSTLSAIEHEGQTVMPADVLVFERYPGSELLSHILREQESKGSSPRVLIYTHPLEKLQDDRIDETLAMPVKPSRLMNQLIAAQSLNENEEGTAEAESFESMAEIPLAILLVEDNRVNQKVTQLMLQKLQLDCDVAVDGHGALECIERKSYDLVLMDIQMPGMDGIEATQRIRRSRTAVQPMIYALSAGTMEDEVERAIEAGMDGFVSKPMVLERLRNVLEEVRHALASRNSSLN